MRYHTARFGCHSYSGSGVIMILVCLVILQDHVIKESYCFMGGTTLIVSHHPAKFGSYRPCGSGDIMFSVAEEKKNSDALVSIRHYCYCHYTANHMNNSDSGHTRLKQ